MVGGGKGEELRMCDREVRGEVILKEGWRGGEEWRRMGWRVGGVRGRQNNL